MRSAAALPTLTREPDVDRLLHRRVGHFELEIKMDSKQEECNKLGDSIVELLRSYRLTHTVGDDSSGFPLVDALTPPGEKSIKLGIEEIELLAGELAWLVISAETPNVKSMGASPEGAASRLDAGLGSGDSHEI